MERKIGEIFEHEGEWYQCVEGLYCDDCAFVNDNCEDRERITLREKLTKKTTTGFCNFEKRNDRKSVIFKKLEKVGEPYGFQKRTFQTYRLHTIPFLSEDVELVVIPSKDNNTIEIEIKQNKKEDMEIDKVVMNIDDRDYLLDRLEAILHDTHCQQYKDEICEAFSKYIVTENVSNSKLFNLEEAKAGKPVCTRDGRKARIICFDAKGDYPIIALIDDTTKETNLHYTVNGRAHAYTESDYDLMMLPEKKEGWVNVYKRENEYIYENECNVSTGIVVYKSEGEAKRNIDKSGIYVNTIKINWEE